MNFYDDIDVYGKSIALILEDGEVVDYSKFLFDADSLKKVVGDRCLVFNVCDNCVESIVGYIGFLRGGFVQFLVSSNTNVDLLTNLLQVYKPKYIWVSKTKATNFGSYTNVYSYRDFVLFKTTFSIDYSLDACLAILLTTSGSTGSPKLVRQSYKNITANANSIAQYLDISPADRPITTLPMSYTFGLSILNSHLLKGSSIIVTNKALVDKYFWELLKENNATTFSGVPYVYEMLKKLGFSRMKLPSIKKLTQAGGKLGRALSEEFAKICEKKGIEFIVMYGQTEATARMSYLPSKYAVSKAGSIGIAIPGGEFLLEDKNGKIITQSNIAGELLYKGENVTMGYADSCYDLCKGDENKGMLRTGDLAERDSDGFYYIVGRTKRFLKLFGNRINLEEVEQILNDKGYTCVCGGEDNNLKIFTTDRDKVSEIQSFIANHTGINPSGFTVSFIEKIPRNEYGRIKYSLLK
jgi:acyl-coenzyme A synthetase/AMP-(fatty) acid ligase